MHQVGRSFAKISESSGLPALGIASWLLAGGS